MEEQEEEEKRARQSFGGNQAFMCEHWKLNGRQQHGVRLGSDWWKSGQPRLRAKGRDTKPIRECDSHPRLVALKCTHASRTTHSHSILLLVN